MLGAGGASRMLGSVASGCRLAVTRGAASLSRECRGVRTMPPWTTRTVTMASRHVKVEGALCWGPSLPVRSGRLCDLRGGYVRGFATEGGVSDYAMDMLEKYMEQYRSGPRDTRARRERVLALSQYLQNELGAQPEEAWGVLNRKNPGKRLLQSPLSTIRGSVEYLMDEIGWSAGQTLDVFHRQPILFRLSTGAIAERLTVLEKHFHVGRKDMGRWLATKPSMLLAADLEAKLDFYLNTVGLTREALMKCSTAAFAIGLNDRIRPRYQFVTQIEERTGLRAGPSPLTYLRYTPQDFDRFLARDFGPGAVVEFAEFRRQYDVEHRPQMRDIVMNDYEREVIEEYCRTHHSVGRDSIGRRERLLNLSRYLQDELGAGEEEAWCIVFSRFVVSRQLVGTRLDTIRGCVEHLKTKEGWSAAQILRVFKRDAVIFTYKAEVLAERIRVIQEKLELTPEEAVSWLEEWPYPIRSPQLEERLAYFMDRVGLSKDDLMACSTGLYSGSLEGKVKPRFEFVQRMEERRGWRVKTLPQTYLSYERVAFERMLRRQFGEDALSEYEAFHAERMKELRGRG